MLTSDEARRAIYFDFEGFKNAQPALIGVLIEDSFKQIVLDSTLASAALRSRLLIGSLCEELTGLLSLAAGENRKLVGFTLHEPTTIKTYCGIEIGSRYTDAHKLAKRWKNSLHPGRSIPDYKLLSFLRFVRYPVPRRGGVQQSTRRLRHVRTMLLERGTYSRLTPSAKRDWIRFLLHNEHDCRGMQFLMQRVTSEFEVER